MWPDKVKDFAYSFVRGILFRLQSHEIFLSTPCDQYLTFFLFFLFTDVWSFSLEDPEEQIAREILADRIGAELREAKARYGHQNANNAPTTSRGSPPEVLLPAGLLHSIAGDILHASRDEPCGVR